MDYNKVEDLKQLIINACQDKKARDIVAIDVSNLTVIADYLVICTGKSAPQVKGIANNVDDEIAKLGLEPLRREGIAEGRWAVVDYGSIIVHIFNDECRLMYCLDQLWIDGDNIEKFDYEA